MNWYNRHIKIAMPKGERKEWTSEELERIKSLLQEGKSFRFIGNLFGVNQGVIKRINDKYNWSNRDKKRDERYKQVLSLYRLPPYGQGISGNQLRQKYNIPESVIKKALEKFNLSHEYRGYGDSPVGVKQSNLQKEIDNQREMIEDLLIEGSYIKEIASLFNTTPGSMRWNLKKLNILPSEDLKNRRREFIREKSLELMREGKSLEYIMKKLRTSHETIRELLGKGDYYNNLQQTYMTDEEKNKIKKLYNEGKTPLEIGRIISRSTKGIEQFLIREGLYERMSMGPLFSPSEEEAVLIDHLYALPPDGRGMSISWLAYKFNTTVDKMIYWFDKTGRDRRSHAEQASTDFTRNLQSITKKEYWDDIGGLKGYLESRGSRQDAIQFLNNYSHIIWEQEDPRKSQKIREDYMKVIENHTYPDEVQQIA